MTEFRDPDRSELATFAQHISIAESMIDLNAELTGGLHIKSTPEEQVAPAKAWDDLGEQVMQARAIALRFRRDVSAVDAAWARTGARTIDKGKGMVVARAAREAAAEAIDALRATFPEVVVPRAAAPKVEAVDTAPLWTPGPTAIYRIALIGTLLLLAIVISVCGVR